jgi:acyl-CoA dehydrogenase
LSAVEDYRIYEGTTQILQLQIAKHMLREFLSGAMG